MNHMNGMLAHAPRKIFIGVFGLSEYELRLVRSVLSLTTASGRAFSYALFDASSGQKPDIAILDPNDAQAVAMQKAGAGSAATLAILASAPADTSGHFLLRPLAPTKMLAQLDQIAAEISQAAQIVPAQPLPTTNSQIALNGSAQPVQQAQQAQQAATPFVPKSGFRALIVDDSPTVRAKIEQEMRPWGVVTDCVESGEQGLQMLSKFEYDIVFLDILLPGADGYEVCRMIKHNRETKRIPVVMLTSKSSPFDRIRGSLAGCSSYLTKPVDHATFHAVVEKYLAQARAQRASNKDHGTPVFA